MSHTLYRIYDAERRLLYVGITSRSTRRINEHLARQPWAGQVRDISFELCADEGEAISKETDAIRLEQPVYNVAGTDKVRRARTPVESDVISENEDWLTVTQAATQLGLNRRTVWQQINNGILAASRLGSMWVITTTEVDRYAREHRGGIRYSHKEVIA
jgi:excisionase family DNA binding protein